MTKEIKEILDYLSDDSKSFIICGVSYYKISDYKAKVLLDYITNLQEEVKEANENAEWWANRFKAVERDKKDYKSRIDKAIEKLKFYNDKISNMYVPVDIVLNILNGGDE